jgi:hypothetical protein
MPLSAGDLLGPYKILSLIGAGGMAPMGSGRGAANTMRWMP